VGNWWIYDRDFYVGQEIQRDSIRLEVMRMDNETCGVATYLLHSRLVTQESGQYDSYFWNRNESDGLYQYGYIVRTSTNVDPSPPRFENHRKIRFKGFLFDDPKNISEFFISQPCSIIERDSIVLEVPPIRTLAYPFEFGTEWDMRAAGEPFRIGRKIRGKLLTGTPAGTFLCWLIDYRWDIDDDGIWDQDMSGADFISEEIGLVRREFHMTLYDYDTNEEIESHDIFQLRSYQFGKLE
jgi:hypothetical protein